MNRLLLDISIRDSLPTFDRLLLPDDAWYPAFSDFGAEVRTDRACILCHAGFLA
jgi:hypothetical protein